MSDRKTNKPEAVATEKVLVVIPDVLIRAVVAEYLRDCGYRVAEALHAAEALAILEKEAGFDALFTEVDLPGETDGFTLSRQVRERYPRLEVVLASGATGLARKSADLCEEGPLERPYHPQQLEQRLRQVLTRRRGK